MSTRVEGESVCGGRGWRISCWWLVEGGKGWGGGVITRPNLFMGVWVGAGKGAFCLDVEGIVMGWGWIVVLEGDGDGDGGWRWRW